MEGKLNRIPMRQIALTLMAVYGLAAAASIGSLLAVAGARPLHTANMARRPVTMPERLATRTGR